MNNNDCPAPNILSLILSFCIALTCLSSYSIAATVTISKKQLLTPSLQLQNPSNSAKKLSVTPRHKHRNYNKNTGFSASSLQMVTTDPPMTLKESFVQNQNIFYNNINKKDQEKSKILLYFDKDYQLLLNSLIGYNRIREFINDTESMINNLTEKLLYSLKLEYKQTMQTELFMYVNSINSNISSLVTPPQLEPQITSRYLKVPSSNSLLNMEQSNQFGANFIDNLFQIETLIYLLSLIIIFSLLKAVIKFFLLRIPS